MKKNILNLLVSTITLSALSASILVPIAVPTVQASSQNTQTNVAENVDTSVEYIPSPYSVDSNQAIGEQYYEPVYYENEFGPTIGVTTLGVLKNVEGQYFKDSNNNQALDPYEDWRLTTDERIADALTKLTVEQKASFILNIIQSSPQAATYDEVVNAEGKVNMDQLLPGENEEGENDFLPNVEKGARAGVLRTQPESSVTALYNNAVGQLSEHDAMNKDEISLPFTILSNPTNTAKDAITSTSDSAPTSFSAYPESLGLAAAVMGNVENDGDYSLITDFANNSRLEWDAQGIDAMYGPQIDIASDPRWPRNNGTYGEHVTTVNNITLELIEGYQQGTNGVTDGGVALTMKHFPGDGASENGFESHSKSGEWRLYPTEGSFENFQLPPFQVAADANVAAMMTGYSRPTNDGRSTPQTVNGVPIENEEVANAYNYGVTTTLLKDMLGFEGYVNSDTGVIPTEDPIEGEITPFNTIKNFGVEEMNTTEAMADMIEAGSDVLGGEFVPEKIVEAVETGLLSEEALDKAVGNRLKVNFEMNRFENPYRDPQVAEDISAQTTTDESVYEAHQKAVVLLKNSENTLPMTDNTKKVYVEYFGSGEVEQAEGKDGGAGDEVVSQKLAAEFEARGFTIVSDYNEADYAYLMVDPKEVNYADPHMTELNLVDGKELDERDIPNSQELTGETIDYTNVADIDQVKVISDVVHENGGKVVASIDATSPWILSNLEPHADALVSLYGSYFDAQVDVLTGVANPTGKLPMTFVSNDAVIGISHEEIDGEMREISASPNDVPGYAKDQYIDPEVLNQSPGGSYAYMDEDGHYYKAGFGLSYD